jgi:hypothetical protein
MPNYDALPEDLAALLEEHDPRGVADLLGLARIVGRCPASLILDALGEFELLTVYSCAVREGIRMAQPKPDPDDPWAEGAGA